MNSKKNQKSSKVVRNNNIDEANLESITIEEPKVIEESNEAELPKNFLEIGKSSPDDVKIYIHQTVFKNLEKHASKNLEKEVGNILIGNTVKFLDKEVIIISDSIEAKYTDSSAASLTFTHRSWDYIHKIRDKKFSNSKIVGWQHTHPNYGIFLSSYDIFIQENFFSLPFQLAYVIDPVQNERGFFAWRNNKIEKVNGFYIYDSPEKEIQTLEETLLKLDDYSKRTSKNSPVYWSAVVLSIIALFTTLFFNYRLQNQIVSLNLEIDRLSGQVNLTKSYLVDVNESIEKINIAFNDNATIIKGIVGRFVFEIYQVKEEDTLESIFEEYKLDLLTYEEIFYEVNGLKNKDELVKDMFILLPFKVEMQKVE